MIGKLATPLLVLTVAFAAAPADAHHPVLLLVGECSLFVDFALHQLECSFTCLPGTILEITSTGTGVWHSNTHCGGNIVDCNADNAEPSCENNQPNLGPSNGVCFAHVNPFATVNTTCRSFVPAGL